MKYLFIIAIGLLTSCSSNLYHHFDYNRSNNPWMDAFKDRVFFTALKDPYSSDSSIFQLIEKKDAFNPYDGLSLKEMQIANELGTSLIKNMPSPSMCENCSDGMNYYMATALHYYNSRELDSIAKKYYKLHIENDME